MTAGQRILDLGPQRYRLCPADGGMPLPAGNDPLAPFLRAPSRREEIAPAPALRLRRLLAETPAALAPPPRPACYRHRGGWELRRAAEAEDGPLWGGLAIPHGTDRYQRLLRVEAEEALLAIPAGAHREDEPLGLLATEVLWLAGLTWRGGLLVHAAAARAPGGGVHLFLGSSGAGKSTLAGLWRDSGRGEALADESVMVWEEDGELLAGGTPWPGSAGTSGAGRGPVAGAYFLEHGWANSLARLDGADAAAAILSQTFLPHWSATALAAATRLASRLAEERPVHRLAFRPDPSVIDYLLAGMGAA